MKVYRCSDTLRDCIRRQSGRSVRHEEMANTAAGDEGSRDLDTSLVTRLPRVNHKPSTKLRATRKFC